MEDGAGTRPIGAGTMEDGAGTGIRPIGAGTELIHGWVLHFWTGAGIIGQFVLPFLFVTNKLPDCVPPPHLVEHAVNVEVSIPP